MGSSVSSAILTCAACGQQNKVGAASNKEGYWKCGRCGARLEVGGFAYPEVVRFAPGNSKTRFPLEIATWPVSIDAWNAACAAGAPLRRDPQLRVAIGVFTDDRLEKYKDQSGKCATVDWDEAQAYAAFLNHARGLAGRPDRFRLPYAGEIEAFHSELRYFEGDPSKTAPGHRSGAAYHWCDADLQVPGKLDPKRKGGGDAVLPVMLQPAETSGWSTKFGKTERLGIRLVRSLPPSASDQRSASHGAINRHFKYDAFISHNQGDGSAELVKALGKYGLKVWHDGDADMSDQRVVDLVFGAIPEARLLCTCVGPNFRNSQWVREEYQFGVALEHGAGAIRVVVVELAPNVEAPAELAHKLRLPAYNGPELLAAHLLAANSATETELEWMVRPDHARLLRESALTALAHPERLVSRHGRAHEVWISVAERQKLDEAFERRARERGDHVTSVQEFATRNDAG